jgi:hypothetical protein
MIKILSLMSVGSMLLAGPVAVTPAYAQAGNQAEVIVFGTDPCPRSTDSEVVVCKRFPESERFRLAPQQRPSGPRQARETWAKRAQDLKTVGDTGIGSCSAVGPGGQTGCLLQEINRAAQDNRESTDQNSAPRL